MVSNHSTMDICEFRNVSVALLAFDKGVRSFQVVYNEKVAVDSVANSISF